MKQHCFAGCFFGYNSEFISVSLLILFFFSTGKQAVCCEEEAADRCLHFILDTCN
jgi:hypothetical protein